MSRRGPAVQEEDPFAELDDPFASASSEEQAEVRAKPKQTQTAFSPRRPAQPASLAQSPRVHSPPPQPSKQKLLSDLDDAVAALEDDDDDRRFENDQGESPDSDDVLRSPPVGRGGSGAAKRRQEEEEEEEQQQQRREEDEEEVKSTNSYLRHSEYVPSSHGRGPRAGAAAAKVSVAPLRGRREDSDNSDDEVEDAPEVPAPSPPAAAARRTSSMPATVVRAGTSSPAPNSPPSSAFSRSPPPSTSAMRVVSPPMGRRPSQSPAADGASATRTAIPIKNFGSANSSNNSESGTMRSPTGSTDGSGRTTPVSSSPRRGDTMRSPRRTAVGPIQVKTPSGVQVPDFGSIERGADGSWSGWLYKAKAQGRINVIDKGWKARFCVWDPVKFRLYYYHYKGEKEHANFLSFDSATRIEPAPSECSPDMTMTGCAFQITTSITHRPYIFCAGTQAVCDEWVQDLLDCVAEMGRLEEEHDQDVDQVWASYETSKADRKLNEPALDVIVEEGNFSKKADYFVACYCAGDQKFRSWIEKSSTNPVWGCDGTFSGENTVMRVKAFTRNTVTGADKIVGECLIDLKPYEEGQIVDEWFPLTSQKRSAEGSVRIRLQKTRAFESESLVKGRGIPTGVLPLRVDTGDMILFHNSHLASQATKVLTRSQWDHIGIVIRWSNNELKLLEATANGVGLYKLKARLEFLWTNTKMAVRRLNAPRTKEMLLQMDTFVQQMRGRHYKKRFVVLVKAAVGNEKERGTDDQDLSSVFCSELVVAAYQRMGLVSNQVSAKGFLPKDLADKTNRGFDLLNGAELERKRIFSRKKDRHVEEGGSEK